MSPSNLHTQPLSPLGPGWEQAPSSYTGCCQPEEKLRAAERRGPAPLGTGAPTGPRTPRGAPRNRCGSDSRRGTQPARVIHCFQQCCGPAGRGAEGGGEAGSRGAASSPGVGGRAGAQLPPLPSFVPAHPGSPGALRDGPAPHPHSRYLSQQAALAVGAAGDRVGDDAGGLGRAGRGRRGGRGPRGEGRGGERGEEASGLHGGRRRLRRLRGWGSAAPHARGPAGARRRCRPGNPAAFI